VFALQRLLGNVDDLATPNTDISGGVQSGLRIDHSAAGDHNVKRSGVRVRISEYNNRKAHPRHKRGRGQQKKQLCALQIICKPGQSLPSSSRQIQPAAQITDGSRS
jgi:hypothetical protein